MGQLKMAAPNGKQREKEGEEGWVDEDGEYSCSQEQMAKGDVRRNR
jgi:hypothetical protein